MYALTNLHDKKTSGEHVKASEEIKAIQTDIAQVKSTGVQQLPIEKLEEYLAQRLDIAVARETETGKEAVRIAEHNLEVWKVDVSTKAAMNVEMFKSVIEAGQTALKALMLINGGAAAALLAFCGNAITKGQSLAGDPLLASAGVGLACFVTGMGAVGLATGFRYFSQYCYARSPLDTSESRWRTAGTIFNILVICIALSGFAAFCVGGAKTYGAITSPALRPSSITSEQPSGHTTVNIGDSVAHEGQLK
ncbi:hypothetical protein [Pandoraea commovens]|uniref:Transmembrane protein n=1 Tax=Pandoraea commovens TaxID=2508289 RepID=A0A5E4SFY5_9BURK|nr:hypothetical protein [Pandoraea commovens]VVD74081.1 hypothetical protein PCO31010_00778 [Pandoraea commovens]